MIQYVTIEGIDGAGKSNLSKRLVHHLVANRDTQQYSNIVLTEEPSQESWIGEAARKALRKDTDVQTDILLFAADRAEHLKSVVLPAIEANSLVISDRGHDSTYAYQVPRLIDQLNLTEEAATAWLDVLYQPWNVEPDMTLWITVSVDTAVDRMSGDEKYEQREFLERVHDHYEHRYTVKSDRMHKIDGEQTPKKVLKDALKVLP